MLGQLGATQATRIPSVVIKPTSPISTTPKDRKIKLLGHVLRLDEDDPMFECTIDGNLNRISKDKKRVGRPRENWIENTTSDAYKTISNFINSVK